jgi:hypothetical protein
MNENSHNVCRDTSNINLKEKSKLTFFYDKDSLFNIKLLNSSDSTWECVVNYYIKEGNIIASWLLNSDRSLVGKDFQKTSDYNSLFEGITITYLQNNCASCHSFQDKEYFAPSFKDITLNRNKEWLKQYIRNRDELINKGDTLARNLFIKYGKKEHVKVNVGDQEFEILYKFLSGG